MTQAKQIIRAVAIAAAALAFTSFAHAAPDADAAKALAKQNNCFKCHAIDKDKDGPSYHSVAEKYKGKPGAGENNKSFPRKRRNSYSTETYRG